MSKTYNVYFEADEGEAMDIETLFYTIKEHKMIEVTLESGNWYYLRQRKDIPITYKKSDWEVFHMEYWTVYCTTWNDIESIWTWWGVDELKEYIETCEQYI